MSKVISIRLSDDEYTTLQNLSKEDNMSISSIMQDAFNNYLEYRSKGSNFRTIIIQLAKIHDKMFPEHRLFK